MTVATYPKTIGQRRTGGIRRIVAFIRDWPLLPVIILILLFVAGGFAPWVSPSDPTDANLRGRRIPPVWMADGSASHVLGTDQQGRDVLSRIIYGARISLVVAGTALGIGSAVGITLGMISGYSGGWVDEAIMRMVDIKLAIPLILVALVLVIVLGQSFALLVGILSINTWSGFARQVRAQTLQLKTRDYVLLARIAGASTRRIMVRHIFPGITDTAIVLATLQVGSVILTEAILSFLGAGIPPPTPAWGSMVSDGRTDLIDAWWIAFFPGLAIFLTVLAFNFLGDWLRDYFDPRLRQVRMFSN